MLTSNEFPQFIQNMQYDYQGNPDLGGAIAETASELGTYTQAHHLDSLELEYGSVVPMRFMSRAHEMKVVSVAAWCTVHDHQESRVADEAIRKAVDASDSKVLLVASGSLSDGPARARHVAARCSRDVPQDAARIRRILLW